MSLLLSADLSEPSVITLNVGGKLFTTSRFTLNQHVGKNELEHVLASMTNGKHPVDRDRDGNVFIDRDGTYFHFLLNYLRNGGNLSLTMLPSVKYQPVTAKAVQLEASYYGLTELVDYFTVQKWLLKKRFQMANCHPNVVVVDGGKTLICKESTGKNWYSVSARYPIIAMDYSSSQPSEIDDWSYLDEKPEIEEECYADSEEINGFPSSNNYILKVAGADGNNYLGPEITSPTVGSYKPFEHEKIDELQITASKLSTYYGNMKLLKYHIKNYYEVTIESTKNFNIVLGISKQKTSYFNDSWTVGFIANSYGYNVWSMKKYSKKTQVDYGERCERGDRIGIYINTALGYVEYFRNGRTMGVAFDGLQKELADGNWFVVASLYNQGDFVTLNNSICPPSSKEEEYLRNLESPKPEK